VTEDGVFKGKIVHDGYSKKYKKFIIEFEGKTYSVKAADEFEIKL
jgi:hypothetical protein